jgi:hypothetical protein
MGSVLHLGQARPGHGSLDHGGALRELLSLTHSTEFFLLMRATRFIAMAPDGGRFQVVESTTAKAPKRLLDANSGKKRA